MKVAYLYGTMMMLITPLRESPSHQMTRPTFIHSNLILFVTFCGVSQQVITVNGARLLKPDIQATNGMIHIVDRVLFPVPQADIYSTLKGDPQQRYTTLVSAIERAGLTSVLANPTGNRPAQIRIE